MTVEQGAIQILMTIGADPGLKGFSFAHKAIVKCYRDETLMDGITKTLYPEIAKECGTTKDAVERNIRTVVHYCKSKHNTNKAFINACVWFLKQLPDVE